MTEPNEKKRAEIIDDLRRLADALEAMQCELTEVDADGEYFRLDTRESLCALSIDLNFHSVHNIQNLRAIRKLCKEMKADKSRGNHWISGKFSPKIEVTAFYRAGLLGKTQKKKTVIVEHEQTDLSVLN